MSDKIYIGLWKPNTENPKAPICKGSLKGDYIDKLIDFLRIVQAGQVVEVTLWKNNKREGKNDADVQVQFSIADARERTAKANNDDEDLPF